ncbi:GAF domain-containing protein [Ancylobacter pratisalsi]|uniref:GAF domain-containing protein n=1 Tax=Ancylobacter pratisalsi TaxID=1745854 RepID=A0A6P1YR08_9HYPH|nr:GAF domain-containing protein [Ancylobacter pratisalsi]QIB35221.1 GAF domain-containing protein [Ancylobacter pratisalsi]
MTDVATLAHTLQPLLAELMERTGAKRCTVRIDHPALGLSVNVPCAEVLAPGARSMMSNSSVDHRRARTVRWIEKSRRTLVQGDVFADPHLAPPAALVEIFGTRSQLVAPLIGRDDYLFGWVSAHFSEGPRVFATSAIEAIEEARRAVLAVPGMPQEI